MQKYLLLPLLLIFLGAPLQAQKLDAIALIVGDQAITTQEIQAVQQQLNISKQEATDLLIENRLELVAISKIEIDEGLVDDRIGKIAQQNGVSVKKMQQLLKEQGTHWTTYRITIRNQLKKERLLQETIMPSIPKPNKDELKLLYKQNQADFPQGSFQKAKTAVEQMWFLNQQTKMLKEHFKKLRTSVKITKLR
jgi:parvulin-like peptidyl-prolyl isomerase